MPRLAVLCDQKAEMVQQEAARYGYEAFCTDWRELAADPRIDVFDNCGPDPVHPEPCIAALAARQARDLREADGRLASTTPRRMRDAAAAAPGKAMCTFNYRFMPAVRLAKDLIAEGRIGTVYQMRVHYLQMAGHDPSLPPDKVWYSAWPHSGGLQGIGSHAIDQCRFLVGEITSVSALVRTFNQERAVHQRRLPAGDHLRRRHGRRAGFPQRRHRRPGILGRGHGQEELSRLGDQRLARLAPLGPGASQQPVRLPGTAGDDSLLGFTEISVTESDHPYVGPWWPQGHNLGWEHCQIIEKFHFLDAVAHGKPLEPAPGHLRGRLPRGRDHRRHAQVEPHRTKDPRGVLDAVEPPRCHSEPSGIVILLPAKDPLSS